jgi:hypothetical protein
MAVHCWDEEVTLALRLHQHGQAYWYFVITIPLTAKCHADGEVMLM